MHLSGIQNWISNKISQNILKLLKVQEMEVQKKLISSRYVNILVILILILGAAMLNKGVMILEEMNIFMIFIVIVILLYEITCKN